MLPFMYNRLLTSAFVLKKGQKVNTNQIKKKQELGKSMYYLYCYAPELIRQLQRQMREIEDDMNSVQTVNYQCAITNSNGSNREEYLLRKIDQKDELERRIQTLREMLQMISVALDGVKDEEIAPYLLNGSTKSADTIGYELGYSERTVYRMIERWFVQLSEEIVTL